MRRIGLYRYFLATLLLVITTSVHVMADDVTAEAYINKDRALIGDRLTFRLEVRTDKNNVVDMPVFVDGKIGEFEIKDRYVRIKNGLFGRELSIFTYDLACYVTGKQTIPALEIKYGRRGSSERKIVTTKARTVFIRSVLPTDKPPQDIKDIKGPRAFGLNPWILAGIILTALVMIIAAVRYFLIRRRGPLKLPHESALEELESLKAYLARSSDVKNYYVGVSDCIRLYIERIFRLKAPEMTTEEFLVSLGSSSSLLPEDKDLLRRFLAACDLVKFAKYVPTRSETELIYETARKFISETNARLETLNQKKGKPG